MIKNDMNLFDDRYLTREDFNEFVDVKLKSNFNSMLNTINSNHTATMIWQKKTLIVGFIISLIIILSFVTSMIINYSNMMNLTKQIAEQNSQILELTTELETIQNELSHMELEVSILKEDTEIKEDNEPIVYNTTDIAHKSGFTEEQFNAIINKVFTDMGKEFTSLTTIGDSLYQVEQENDVNGLYLLGIASLESGWGTSDLAILKNNLYGMHGCKFDSVDECTIYMGNLMRDVYIDQGLNTLSKIQRLYCPPGGSKWVNDVTWCTYQYINAANALYPQN